MDRAIRGDYYNLFATIDLTIPRLKRTLMLGTRWGDASAQLVPAPGDPAYLNYTYDPLKTGVAPPPPDGLDDNPPVTPPPAAIAAAGPILPLVPPSPTGPRGRRSTPRSNWPPRECNRFSPDPMGPRQIRRPTHRRRRRREGRLMLTRFVRTQLIIFTIASIVGVAIMMFAYVQLPTLLGLGRITVTLDLPATGGLYQFSNVTYRGLQVGKVTSVELTDTGAQATLSLDTSPKIPADLKAEVRSMSAVGEQYVELLPRNDKAPYLQDGSVIPVGSTSIPQSVGPMLDQVSKLMDTIPKDKLSQLLGETYQAFNGTGYDFGSLLDSGATITRDVNGIADNTRALIDDARPFIGAQEMTTDSIRTWAQSLAGITEQVADNDPQFRSILRDGPGFAQETSRLLEQIKPTLPLLLANMTTFGQIFLTYNKSIEQLLVLVPPFVAQIQTYLPSNSPAGLPNGDFALGLGDPRRARSGSCRRRRGATRPIPRSSTHPMICTANCRRTRRSRFAVRATIRALNIRVSGRRQSSCATTPKVFSRWLSGNM